MNKIGKAFEKKEFNRKNIMFLEYDPAKDHDYYAFVRNKRELNYYQVIITSEMMIEILDYYFLERHASISSIELMESDDHFEQEIENILLKIDSDRAYYSRLISLLNFIKEESSIDIKKINIKNNSKDNQFRMYIQVNGLIGINQEVYDLESDKISKLLERCINK